MRALLLLLILYLQTDHLLGLTCENLQSAKLCDKACQLCQQKALLEHLWTLNGPEWKNQAGWPAEGSLNYSEPLQHCEWYGIYCCGPDNTLLNVEDPYQLRYTYTNRTTCSVPFGVALILLGNNGLKGSMQASMFSTTALKLSLEVFRADSKSSWATL